MAFNYGTPNDDTAQSDLAPDSPMVEQSAAVDAPNAPDVAGLHDGQTGMDAPANVIENEDDALLTAARQEAMAATAGLPPELQAVARDAIANMTDAGDIATAAGDMDAIAQALASGGDLPAVGPEMSMVLQRAQAAKDAGSMANDLAHGIAEGAVATDQAIGLSSGFVPVAGQQYQAMGSYDDYAASIAAATPSTPVLDMADFGDGVDGPQLDAALLEGASMAARVPDVRGMGQGMGRGA